MTTGHYISGSRGGASIQAAYPGPPFVTVGRLSGRHYPARPWRKSFLSVRRRGRERGGGGGRASKPVSGIDTEEVSRPLHVDIRALCERRRGVGADWHAL